MSPINECIDESFRSWILCSQTYAKLESAQHYVLTTRLAAIVTLVIEVVDMAFEGLRCLLYVGGFAMKKGLHFAQVFHQPRLDSLKTMDGHLPDGPELAESFSKCLALFLGSLSTILFGILASPDTNKLLHQELFLIEKEVTP